MLNILFDYQIFSLQQYGGISRYFSEIAWRMDQLESCRTTLFCPLYRNSYLKEDYARYNVWGWHVTPPPKTATLMRLLNKGINRVYGATNKFDIVHKTYFWDLYPRGGQTVVTVYDMINELYPEHFPGYDPLPGIKLSAVQHADAVICISHNTKIDLLNLINIDPRKVFVTHLGFSTLPGPTSRTCNPQLPTDYVLFVGKRGGHKNFEGFIKGFANSERLRRDFQIVCFGDVDFSSGEKEMFVAYGLKQNRIRHMVGDDEHLARAYQNAAVFVYPSLYEGFGIPPLEAMSCNCPVVCSDTSSLPEVVGDAAELCDPYNLDSIQSGLENVLYSPERARELIGKGAGRHKQFTWERCARVTLDVYQSL